jgi:hypothetical protein
MGAKLWQMVESGVFGVLDGGFYVSSLNCCPSEETFEKNIRFYKNFICILEKMGYNRME